MIKVDIAAREIQIMEKMTVVGGIYKALFRGTEVCSSWFALLHNDCECNVTMNPGVANLRTQVLRLCWRPQFAEYLFADYFLNEWLLREAHFVALPNILCLWLRMSYCARSSPKVYALRVRT